MDNGKSQAMHIFSTLLALSALGGLGYLGYQNYQLTQKKIALEADLATTKQEYASTSQSLSNNIQTLQQLLLATQEDVQAKQAIVATMQAQVEAMSGTLGTLKKLANTNRELLKKYSRIYFLSENYIPPYTTRILDTYVNEPEKEKTIATEVWPFLQKLLDDANATTTDLRVASAYRSFETQNKLKTAYTVSYGSGANKFSADQGYSEHQLGTTVDFTTVKLKGNSATFEKTPAYAWLTENAYKYGFILSYPKKNAYYVFEPWHWRFVGKNLALKLHNENKNFYDLTQNEIDEYLVTIFD
ncbi:MAG: M15 family metallopeptidase [Patescibacteria group bacterium]